MAIKAVKIMKTGGRILANGMLDELEEHPVVPLGATLHTVWRSYFKK